MAPDVSALTMGSCNPQSVQCRQVWTTIEETGAERAILIMEAAMVRRPLEHAVVLGGSVAGLLTVRVLSEHFRGHSHRAGQTQRSQRLGITYHG